LGFPARQAEQTVEAVLADNGGTDPVDTAATLRTALSRLGRAR
jgi:hypothetical protein